MVINQQSLQGLYVSYSTIYNQAFSNTKTCYEKIATIVPSSNKSQSYNWLGQIPEIREWIGERELQNLTGHEYTIKNKKFELTVAVPADDIEDDEYGTYAPLFGNLGNKAAKHPDKLVVGALQNGFVNKCYDRKSFFAADHKMGGQVYSNISDQQLSIDSYGAARTAIMSYVGDAGESLDLVPNLLVVSPKNEDVGNLILKADLINGTSNTKKGTAELLVTTQLSSTPDAWFLLCTDGQIKPIIYQRRRPYKFISLTNDSDPNKFYKDIYVYGADGRSNAGYGFWQMAYGSTGETQAQG